MRLWKLHTTTTGGKEYHTHFKTQWDNSNTGTFHSYAITEMSGTPGIKNIPEFRPLIR